MSAAARYLSRLANSRASIWGWRRPGLILTPLNKAMSALPKCRAASPRDQMRMRYRCSAESRVGVADVLMGQRGPGVDATNAPVALDGSYRAGVQFVVNEVSTPAVQIDALAQMVGCDEHT